MKKIRKKLILALATTGLLFGSVVSSAQEKDVKKVAEDFVKSADIQDPELLASVLFKDAKQFVRFGPQILQSTADEYIEQIKEKKLGGNDRKIDFENVLLEGEDVAYVKLKAIGGGLTFSYQLTMFKFESDWKIVTITTKAWKS